MFSRALTAARMISASAGVSVPELEQVLRLERVGREAADGEHGAIQGQRRDDRVHARAVGQPRIHHGGGLVHAPAHRRDDALDHLQEVGVVAEDDARALELARGARCRPRGAR